MKAVLLCIAIFSIQVLACEISWETIGSRTPLSQDNVRPQGLTQFNDKLVLTNHYKDSRDKKTSNLIILNSETLKVENIFSFPKPFYHIGGLASDESYIYAVDFDNDDFIKIDLTESIKSGVLIVTKVFKIPVRGASGLSISNNVIAISDYIVPFRPPFFSDRIIRFLDLNTGEEIKFKGQLKSSNYSQGLTFVKIKNKDLLIESINVFGSVVNYWVTGKDNTPDIVRIYQIDFESREIKYLADTNTPSIMIEDLAWIGKNEILTTDEQSFSFLKGKISNCF